MQRISQCLLSRSHKLLTCPKPIRARQTNSWFALALLQQGANNMIRTNKSFILLVAALGIWGCSRTSTAEAPETARIRALEAKVEKLEEDFRSAAEARDQFRDKLDAVEKERAALQKQLQVVLQDRNDLRLQVTARIKERDTLQVQFDGFRNELRQLLGQADATAAAHVAGQPVTSVSAKPVSVSGK